MSRITKKDILLKEKYNNIIPLCKCGCGTKMNYEPKLKDFCQYKRGHMSKNIGHWGNLKDEKRVNGIINTRKAKFASGEYDHIKQAIKNRDPIELGKKISKGAKGIAKPKPDNFGVGRIHSQETKNKMSNSAIQNIIKTGRVKRSNLEIMFEGILKLLEIKYKSSYYVSSINKIFDFYLPDYKILIEVDGDFWHCNPIKYIKSECKTQEINLINDKFKNKWAKDNGYKLLRFWENDINNNIKEVKKILIENCKPK